MNIPQELEQRLRLVFPGDTYRKVLSTFKSRPTSFRVNLLKASVSEILDQLKRAGVTVRRVPWTQDGFILHNSSQRELERTSIYREGKIWLQSLASMVPVVVLNPIPGEKVLDMTAAPGSKTSQIAALLKRGELVACEKDKIRFERLKHTCNLLGVQSSDEFLLQLIHGDALDLFVDDNFTDYFDAILLDAPCSAEATIGSDGKRVASSWKLSDVQKNSLLQSKLLDVAWKALKPGGRLVYSTCTFAPEENEEQISKFLEKRSSCVVDKIPALQTLNRIPVVSRWNGKSLSPKCLETLRILPSLDIEGFFVAKLKKV